MTKMPWQLFRTRRPTTPEHWDDLWERLLDAEGAPEPGRSDCCVARPAFRVILPATAARAQPTDLLFCGHHYRGARDTLHHLDATVLECGSRVLEDAAAG